MTRYGDDEVCIIITAFIVGKLMFALQLLLILYATWHWKNYTPLMKWFFTKTSQIGGSFLIRVRFFFIRIDYISHFKDASEILLHVCIPWGTPGDLSLQFGVTLWASVLSYAIAFRLYLMGHITHGYYSYPIHLCNWLECLAIQYRIVYRFIQNSSFFLPEHLSVGLNE